MELFGAFGLNMRDAGLFNVKAGGKYNNQCALKG
jgi:hypothetical protein